MTLHLSRRAFLTASTGLMLSSTLHPLPAFAAVQEIEGSIGAAAFNTIDKNTKINGLLYKGKDSHELRLQADVPVKWTVKNTADADITLRLQGLRAALKVNGKRIMGSSVSIVKAQSATIEFTPQDAGSFYVAIASAAHMGAFPLIIEGTAPKFEQDVTILLHDQPKAGGGFEYCVNSGMPMNANFSQGALVRLRLINATRSGLLPFVFAGGLVRTIALDGHAIEPYEPFQGRLALGPGQRADVAAFIPQNQIQSFLVDTVFDKKSYPLFTAKIAQSLREKIIFKPEMAALPAANIPQRYALAEALRVEWDVQANAPKTPHFTAKQGQTVVLTLDNVQDAPFFAQIEGHCMRPLDSLDDGMKPYVRDAVLLPPKARQKFAFIPEIEGTWRVIVASPGDVNKNTVMEFGVS